MNNHTPVVSVIIPVYRNPTGLAICLQALKDQSYPRDQFEVLVVNNSGTEDECSKVALSFGARVLYEEKPGSYAARNHGVANARGSVLAFTDSDCIPSHDWIASGVSALLEFSGTSLVAGKIELTFSSALPNIVELYDDCFLGFPQARFVQENGFGATANVFVAREVFTAVGPYNENLKSWGDREWGERARSLGFKAHYAENTVVRHAARRTIPDLTNKVKRNIGGQIDFQGGQSFYKLGAGCYGDLKSVPTYSYHYHRVDQNPTRRAAMIGLLFYLSAVRMIERWRLFLGAKASRI